MQSETLHQYRFSQVEFLDVSLEREKNQRAKKEVYLLLITFSLLTNFGIGHYQTLEHMNSAQGSLIHPPPPRIFFPTISLISNVPCSSHSLDKDTFEPFLVNQNTFLGKLECKKKIVERQGSNPVSIKCVTVVLNVCFRLQNSVQNFVFAMNVSRSLLSMFRFFSPCQQSSMPLLKYVYCLIKSQQN